MNCTVYIKPSNPRHASCLRCSRAPETHPKAKPTTRPRDVASEREITREAARGVVDPEPLIAFSEVRISEHSHQYVKDSMLVSLRNHIREATEEAADLRNYLVWFIQENEGTEDAHDAFLALRHLLLAYDLLCR